MELASYQFKELLDEITSSELDEVLTALGRYGNALRNGYTFEARLLEAELHGLLLILETRYAPKYDRH